MCVCVCVCVVGKLLKKNSYRVHRTDSFRVMNSSNQKKVCVCVCVCACVRACVFVCARVFDFC